MDRLACDPWMMIDDVDDANDDYDNNNNDDGDDNVLIGELLPGPSSAPNSSTGLPRSKTSR